MEGGSSVYPVRRKAPYDPTVPAVNAAVRILWYLFEQRRSRAYHIANALGLNRSSCHGILKTLVTGGLLEFDPDSKSYSLGPVLLALGTEALQASRYIEVARPLLERWVADTQFTVGLARVLPDRDFLIVDRVEGTRNIRVTVSIGERFPLAAAALGKAYLAWLPAAEATALLTGLKLPPFTTNSITSQGQYVAELEKVRGQGWSSSVHEYYGGTNAVAAPVFGLHGEVVLVVCSLAADTDMTTTSLPAYGTAIRRLADQLSHRLLTQHRPTAGIGRER